MKLKLFVASQTRTNFFDWNKCKNLLYWNKFWNSLFEFVASYRTIGTNIRICTIRSNSTIRTKCSIGINGTNVPLELIFQYDQLDPFIPLEQNCSIEINGTNCSTWTNIKICSLDPILPLGPKQLFYWNKNVTADLRKHMKSSHKDLLLYSKLHCDLNKKEQLHP